MSDKSADGNGKGPQQLADITDLTAFIARRRARGAGNGSGRSLSKRLMGGDGPRSSSHPADAILRALDTKVEAAAHNEARAEIDALADEVKLVAGGGAAPAIVDGPSSASVYDDEYETKPEPVHDRRPKLVATLEAGLIEPPVETPPERRGDWSWIGDMADVAIAENGGKIFIGEAREPAESPPVAMVPRVEASAEIDQELDEASVQPAGEETLSSWARSTDSFEFFEPLPEPEPIRLFGRGKRPTIIEDTPEAPPVEARKVEAPVVETPLVKTGLAELPSVASVSEAPLSDPAERSFFGLRPGTAFDEGDKREALPLWLHLGLPIAAVSAAALAIALHNLNKTDAAAGSDADATPPDASAGVEATLPETADAGTAIDVGSSEIVSLPAPEITEPPVATPAEPELETVTTPAPSGSPEVTPSETVSSEPVASEDTGRVNTFVSPSVPGRLAPAPSVKPDTIPRSSTATISPSPQTGTSAAIRPIATPAGSRGRDVIDGRSSATDRIPARLFTGPIEPGSAAEALVEIANESGIAPLTPTEARWLSRDLDEAFDNEIDGRSVSIKSKLGDRYRISFENSYQDLKEYPIERWRDMAPIPDFLVIESGWFAATQDTLLRATPSPRGAFRRQAIEPGMLLERIGTFTDAYGDRWYLIRSNGVAVGYVSPADVVLAELYEGDVGLPLSISASAHTVAETVKVYTECRTATIGPEGGYWQAVEACRNPNGHWVSPAVGYVPPRSFADAGSGPVEQEEIVLAAALPSSAGADPVLAKPSVQDDLNIALPYLPEGQELRRTLTDGSDVTFTFGERFQKNEQVKIVRVDAVGRIDRPVKVDGRWMQVPGGARLRPTPSYLTSMTLGRVEAGEAVETLARATGNHGGEWVLVGRGGVGFGWVAEAQLAELAGTEPVKAMANVREGQAMIDTVEASIPCRTVDYAGAGAAGSAIACQQSNGQWAFDGRAPGSSFAEVGTTTTVAP
ncbi:MAG: hypothetical protein AAF950_11795 [Pseudomonadota bacterium]